jgi:hypothetical protein
MDVTQPERHFSRRQEKRLLKLAAKVSRTEFPNPERAGCPPAEVLKALANRRIPLEETGDVVDHIGTCSPCFAQYWGYRQGRKRRATVGLLLLCLGVVALIGILVSRVGWRLRPQSKQERQIAKQLPKQQVFRQLVLDLRTWSIPVPDQRREKHVPNPYSPCAVLLSIYLPIGSAGRHIRRPIPAPAQTPSLETRGEALRLRDHIELLEARLDILDAGPRQIRCGSAVPLMAGANIPYKSE